MLLQVAGAFGLRLLRASTTTTPLRACGAVWRGRCLSEQSGKEHSDAGEQAGGSLTEAEDDAVVDSFDADSSSSSSNESSFVDRARVFVVGGTGGQGHKRFASPGADGGDVFVQADATVHNLRSVAEKHRYKAGAGEPGTRHYKSKQGQGWSC